METSDKLKTAWLRRSEFLEQLHQEKTDCYRLFSGSREGISDLKIDVFADVGLIYTYGDEKFSSQVIHEIGGAVQSLLGVNHVLWKKLPKVRSQSARTKVVIGNYDGDTIVVSEKGIQYGVRPLDGFSAGLFLDQRENKAFLAGMRAKSVLNLFSYTCSFSVACAAMGSEVTSVDISKKSLNWGRDNFVMNDIPLDSHRFIQENAMIFLNREKKRNEVYDLVIVDPPSFSRDLKGKIFSIQRDLKALLEGSWQIVAPGGKLFFASNLSGWTTKELKGRVRNLLPTGSFVHLPCAPFDFRMEEFPLSNVLVSKS